MDFADEQPDALLTAPLLEQVEALKNIFVSRAQGGAVNAGLYRDLRRAALNDPEVKTRLPRFVITCRNLDEFWGFIQPKFARYAERRDFLREQFADVLAYLEGTAAGPGAATAELALQTFDEAGVRSIWLRMLERRETDPEGAITAARTLLETLCKHILDDLGVEYSPTIDLPGLHRLVATNLNLAPDQHSQEVFKKILGGCATVVTSLSEVRNKLSDAHGKGRAAVRPAPRHAELAVNLAGSMAAFLVATWAARRSATP